MPERSEGLAPIPSANPDFPEDLAWGFLNLAPRREDDPPRVAIGLYSSDLGAEMEFCLEWLPSPDGPPVPQATLFADAIELMQPCSPIFMRLARLAELNPRFSPSDLACALSEIDAYDLTRSQDFEPDQRRFSRARLAALVSSERREIHRAAAAPSFERPPPRL